jgi:hypothetical protein
LIRLGGELASAKEAMMAGSTKRRAS